MREIYVIIGVFLFLTLGMHHKEWITYPLEHISNLPTSGAYGLGYLHPLLFTIIAYIILWIPRGIYKLIKRK